MEGRWTIIVTHSDEVIGDCRWENAARDDLLVPVVPCDDAAIERGREWYRNAGPHLTSYEIVTGILRAAGETP